MSVTVIEDINDFPNSDGMRPAKKNKPAWTGDGEMKENQAPGTCKHLHRLDDYLGKVRFCLAIFGMYYKQRRKGKAGDSRVNVCQSTLIYNIAVLTFMWMNFVRSILSFWVDNSDNPLVVIRVITTVWCLQVCINVTVMLKSSHPRHGHQCILCIFWEDKVIKHLRDCHISTETTRIRWNLMAGFIFSLICISVNTLSLGCIMFVSFGSMSDTFAEIMISPLPVNTWTKILVLPLFLLNTVSWILSMFYCVVLSTVIRHTLLMCNKAMEQSISMNPERFPTNFTNLRILHLKICNMVDLVDSDMKYLFANWYGTSIPLSCFILYCLMKNTFDPFSLSLLIFWLVSGMLLIFIISGFAAMLHETAHAPLDFIHDTSMKDVSVEQLGQMQLFLSKLSSKSTGFSVLNFFVLTKEILLTVGGLYLTYFFLLLQF